MKLKQTFVFLTAALGASVAMAASISPAFTYQGQLEQEGRPANGIYDFIFALHDNPTNVPMLGTFVMQTAVPVTNGLFTLELNTNGEFGTNAFTGGERWLEMGVRTNVNYPLNFTYIAPRQRITATPYASLANVANSLSGPVASDNLAGTYASAITLNNAANSFSGNGGGLRRLLMSHPPLEERIEALRNARPDEHAVRQGVVA